LRAKRKFRKYPVHKKNPLKNLGFMLKLNPYAKSIIRKEVKASLSRKLRKDHVLAKKRQLKKEGKKPELKQTNKPKAKKPTKEGRKPKVIKKIKMNLHKKAFLKKLHS